MTPLRVELPSAALRHAARVMALAVALLAPAWAQSDGSPDADRRAQALSREVMSPFCPGLTLADCPSQQAFEMRGDIARRLNAGESQQAIVDELVATYGAKILADPSDTPIGRIVWGVPMVLSALAAVALALFLRRVTRRVSAERTAEAEITPAVRGRLDEELAALD